ncbi:MAG: YHS domain-containing protein [Thermoplasmatota archaeon]
METDPVCKMKVNPKISILTSEYKGKKYYFCAPGCRFMFEKDPERYLGSDEPAVEM